MGYQYSTGTKQKMIEGAKRSAKIQTERMLSRINEYNNNPSLCKFCKSKLPYSKRNNKFCNHSCFASFSNKGLCRNSIERKRRKKSCEICGKETVNLKFCSRKCFHKNIEQKIDKEIISGKYKITQSGNPVLYKFLIRNRGYKCENCLGEKWQNENIPLTIHHIDGNASNNLPSNLQLLCWNCHALTPNYGKKNKNSTRDYRYKNNNHKDV